jgi:beta-lactamase superfamily II metal-dependent hydrolase
VSPDQQFTTASYRQVGAQVLHTAELGAVQFTLDQQGIECAAFIDR